MVKPNSGPLTPGRNVGKYRLLGLLGRGGMADVYDAEDAVLGRRVALKLLAPTRTADEDVRRFLREARAVSSVRHPNVVAVYEAGIFRGVPYLAMELVRGGSAEDLLAAGGPLPWPQATRLAADACRGLAAAHAAGLVHRDIKPANLMIDGGAAKLADFGLVKHVGDGPLSQTSGRHVLGTPDYMSPEQCRSEALDGRSDVYSLGATYFALLTGGTPYSAEGAMGVMFAHCSGPVPDPRRGNPALPRACAAIVRRAMAKEPSRRYPTAGAMLSDLDALLAEGAGTATVPAPPAHGPRHAVRRRLVRAVGLAALLLALVAAAHRAGRDRAAGGGAPAVAPSPSAPPQPPPESGLPEAPPRLLAPLRTRHAVAVSGMVLSPRGDLLAWAGNDPGGPVVLWDMAERKERHSFAVDGPVSALAFSPDGRTLAAATYRNGCVHFWDVERGERLTQRPGEVGESAGAVSALAFSPDGTTLAVGMQPWNPQRRRHSARLWDWRHNRRLAELPGHEGRVLALAFSPDGRALASGGHDGTVRLWDVAAHTQRCAWPTAIRFVHSVSFSAGGTFVAAGGARHDGALHLAAAQVWEAATGRERPVPDRLGYGHARVAFAPAGPLLAVVGGRKCLWDVASGREVGLEAEGRPTDTRALGFSHDGRVLAAAGGDRAIRFWGVRPRAGPTR